jgi:hypothetical protein
MMRLKVEGSHCKNDDLNSCSIEKGYKLTKHVEARNLSHGHEDSPELTLTPYIRWWRSLLATTFLPGRYGSSYIKYSVWNGISNSVCCASSTLASTFLLYSVGLGAGAIPTAGAMSWILKDGLGQLGTLLFGKAVASQFDIHSKSWFFLSQILLVMASALELCTILAPSHFLLMAATANAIKGLAVMASSSTRSVFNLSFSKNNLADVTAKSTSQWILSSLIGAGIGIGCAQYIGQDIVLGSLAYGVLSIFTLGSSWMAVKSIPVSSINATRLSILCDIFLAKISAAEENKLRRWNHRRSSLQHSSMDESEPMEEDQFEKIECSLDRIDSSEMHDSIPTPVEMAEIDPPLPSLWHYLSLGSRSKSELPIVVGTSVSDIVNQDADLLVVLLTTYRFSKYIAVPTVGGGTASGVHIVLHEAAENREIIQAFLQASLLREKRRGHHHGDKPENLVDLRIALQDSLLAAERVTTPFLYALREAGWSDQVLVEIVSTKRRARW